MLIYVIAWATIPTILVTVRIASTRVTHTLLTVFPSLFKLPFELLHFLRHISHLTGIRAALLPGLLRGIEGLSRLSLLLTFPVEPATLSSAVHGEGPASSLALFAILGETSFLGGWSLRTAFPTVLPRHLPSKFRGCASLGLVGSGFIVGTFNVDLLNILEVVEHCYCRLEKGLVVHFILVPPLNGAGRQNDTSCHGVIEWDVPLLGGSNR